MSSSRATQPLPTQILSGLQYDGRHLHRLHQLYRTESWCRKTGAVPQKHELCLLYATCVGLILGISLYLLRVPFLSLFTNDAEVVTAGTTRLAIMALPMGLAH